MNKRFTYALVLALGASVVGGDGAGAMSTRAWHDLLEILPDLKTMFDAAPGLIANDLPSLVEADGDLQERLGRAKKFHVTHEFKEAEPKIDGDRLFSHDPKVSTTMRDEYASFVDDEAGDIEMLKTRRDAQAGSLADYQRLLDRNVDYINRAPDLIERASKGTVSDELAQELASVLLTAEHAKPLAEDLVNEYQRIVREYDGKIRIEEAAHSAHLVTLGIVDAIRPKPESASGGAGGVAPPATGKPSIATGGGRTSDARIRDAVSGATAGVDAHASRTQAELSKAQRQMGPVRPMPSQQGPAVPTQQSPPDFTGTMTPYSH